MITIPIDRNSIRRNPQAGRTVLVIDHSTTIELSLKGPFPDEVAEEFLKLPGAQVDFEPNGTYKLSSNRLILEQAMEWVERGELYHAERSFTSSSNRQEIPTRPQPDYLYEHCPTPICCENCHTPVLNTSIELDSVSAALDDDDWREIWFKVCPVCGAHNSFPEYIYEAFDKSMVPALTN